jgi:FAD/FMN-containing dehydrogenase
MTDEQAARLREGDTVLALVRGEWRPEQVVYIKTWGRKRVVTFVRTRQPGLTPSGRLRELLRRLPRDLCHSHDYAPEPANVYADFLEEHGHPEAADLLRKSFPLADGRPDPKPPTAFEKHCVRVQRAIELFRHDDPDNRLLYRNLVMNLWSFAHRHYQDGKTHLPPAMPADVTDASTAARAVDMLLRWHRDGRPG